MTAHNSSVAVLFHRLGPYHLARIAAAARRLTVVAVESSGVDKTYAWDKVAAAGPYQRITLFEQADAQTLPAAEVVRRTAEVLDQVKPAVVVVPGWGDAFALAASQWCLQNRVPTVLMSESTAWDEPRQAWREAVKRQVVGLGSAALVGGTPHQAYIEQLGLPARRVFLGYDVVDNEYFVSATRAVRAQADALRVRHGLPGRYFLASNRFISKKNLPRVLEAYARYRSQAAGPWNLVLLGDGALRPDLMRLVASLGLADSVQLPGFKQYPELPVYYGLAGAFIHASTSEQWGLVVNEAMASGLPVLVSNRCGCAMNLVQEGDNGFSFDPENVGQLAGLMTKIAAPDFPLAAFGAASQNRIAEWGPERFGAGLQQAVECALRTGPVRPTLLQRAVLALLLRR